MKTSYKKEILRVRTKIISYSCFLNDTDSNVVVIKWGASKRNTKALKRRLLKQFYKLYRFHDTRQLRKKICKNIILWQSKWLYVGAYMNTTHYQTGSLLRLFDQVYPSATFVL